MRRIDAQGMNLKHDLCGAKLERLVWLCYQGRVKPHFLLALSTTHPWFEF